MRKRKKCVDCKMLEDISLCRDGCFCMTKTIKGRCGKCGKIKKENGRKK